MSGADAVLVLFVVLAVAWLWVLWRSRGVQRKDEDDSWPDGGHW